MTKNDNPESATQDGGDNPTHEVLLPTTDNNDVEMLGFEEFYDYVFPDDERTGKGKSVRNLKLLEIAHKWKQTEAK